MVSSKGKVQGQILILLFFGLCNCIHLSAELLWIFTVIHKGRLQWIFLLISYVLVNISLKDSYTREYHRSPSYNYIPTQDPLQMHLITFPLSLTKSVITKVYNISSSGSLKGVWELWWVKHSYTLKNEITSLNKWHIWHSRVLILGFLYVHISVSTYLYLLYKNIVVYILYIYI